MAKTLPPGSPRSMLANTFSYLPTSFVRDHVRRHESGDSDISACLATADAVDKLVEILELKTTLSDFNVPREDLPKLAKTTYEATVGKPGWKGICPSEEQILRGILEPIF